MKATIMAFLFAFVLVCAGHAQVTAEEQASMTPEGVLSDLLAGNARYVAGRSSAPDVRRRIEASAKGQHPKAVILSCLDSRVPVELVFDQGIGDLFVGRVAGNVETIEQLGSMEFAAKLAGVKLVMVLGHSHCGAVKGACDGAKLGNLSHLLAQIRPVVMSVRGFEGSERSSKNPAFVQRVVEANVHKTVEDIRRRSPVLRELEGEGKIRIVGALYDLHSGRVSLLH